VPVASAHFLSMYGLSGRLLLSTNRGLPEKEVSEWQDRTGVLHRVSVPLVAG